MLGRLVTFQSHTFVRHTSSYCLISHTQPSSSLSGSPCPPLHINYQFVFPTVYCFCNLYLCCHPPSLWLQSTGLFSFHLPGFVLTLSTPIPAEPHPLQTMAYSTHLLPDKDMVKYGSLPRLKGHFQSVAAAGGGVEGFGGCGGLQPSIHGSLLKRGGGGTILREQSPCINLYA